MNHGATEPLKAEGNVHSMIPRISRHGMRLALGSAVSVIARDQTKGAPPVQT